MAGKREAIFMNVGGGRLGGVDVADIVAVGVEDVAALRRLGATLEIEVLKIFMVFVDQRRAFRHGFLDGRCPRKLLVTDIDQLGGIFRDLDRLRDHDGNGLAYISHAVDRDDRPVFEHDAPAAERGDILADKHVHDAVHRTGGARVDRNDAGMNGRRANHKPMQHSRNRQVGNVLGAARDLFDQVGPNGTHVVNRRHPQIRWYFGAPVRKA